MWAIEPTWFSEMVASVRAGTLIAVRAADGEGEGDAPPYTVDESGLAVIGIEGAMMKRRSKFGGASTRETQRALRAAVADPTVRGIMLAIDSPGGAVSGVAALADEVRSANLVKPVAAYGEDLMASAAYWVGSQARRVTAGATSRVGSIGVLSVLYDSSGAYEKAGIRVHVIGTGEFKGAGTDGAPVREEDLAYFRETAEDLATVFRGAVARGRGAKPSAVKEWASGKVWEASRATEMGLLDGVESFEKAMAWLRKESRPKSRSRAEIAAREIAFREAGS